MLMQRHSALVLEKIELLIMYVMILEQQGSFDG